MKREVIGSGWLALGNRVGRRAVKANRADPTLQDGQCRFPLQIGIFAVTYSPTAFAGASQFTTAATATAP